MREKSQRDREIERQIVTMTKTGKIRDRRWVIENKMKRNTLKRATREKKIESNRRVSFNFFIQLGRFGEYLNLKVFWQRKLAGKRPRVKPKVTFESKLSIFLNSFLFMRGQS